jgi:hypothetical protein
MKPIPFSLSSNKNLGCEYFDGRKVEKARATVWADVALVSMRDCLGQQRRLKGSLQCGHRDNRETRGNAL